MPIRPFIPSSNRGDWHANARCPASYGHPPTPAGVTRGGGLAVPPVRALFIHLGRRRAGSLQALRQRDQDRRSDRDRALPDGVGTSSSSPSSCPFTPRHRLLAMTSRRPLRGAERWRCSLHPIEKRPRAARKSSSGSPACRARVSNPGASSLSYASGPRATLRSCFGIVSLDGIVDFARRAGDASSAFPLPPALNGYTLALSASPRSRRLDRWSPLGECFVTNGDLREPIVESLRSESRPRLATSPRLPVTCSARRRAARDRRPAARAAVFELTQSRAVSDKERARSSTWRRLLLVVPERDEVQALELCGGTTRGKAGRARNRSPPMIPWSSPTIRRTLAAHWSIALH